MQASPAKLPDGDWGVRVYDPGQAGAWTGQAVTVESKGGKSWTSVLAELVSHDEAKGVALYRKAKKAKEQQPTLLTEHPPIAGGASEDEPTEDLVITKVDTTDPMIRTLADLLKAAHEANPSQSIADLAHTAAALALKEV
jgi:hypothetical protein